MQYSYLIIDDEKLSRDYIHDLILEFDPVALINEASCVKSALCAVETNKYDVVFLDVLMPGDDGFSFLQLVKNRDFELVMITAYNEYAVKAFNQGASDYLLKPIKKLEFNQTISKIINKRKKELAIKEYVPFSGNDRYLNTKLIINNELGSIIITVRDIIYLEADNTYTTIYSSFGEKIVTSKPINYFEKTLSARWFFRIHKSNMINLNHFKEYLSLNGKTVQMNNGIKLHISRYRLSEFLQRIKGLA